MRLFDLQCSRIMLDSDSNTVTIKQAHVAVLAIKETILLHQSTDKSHILSNTVLPFYLLATLINYQLPEYTVPKDLQLAISQ